jgi:hypothetical protein
MDKKQEALSLSEELLKEIELKKIDDYSAILKCLRIARLIDDNKAIQWFQYETSGYSAVDNKVSMEAKNIACEHGRSILKNGKEIIFYEPVGEIISLLDECKTIINNMTNSNLSVAGENAHIAVRNNNYYVASFIKDATEHMIRNEKKLAKLRYQYYDYVLKVNIELKFSSKVTSIFSQYKNDVDNEMLGLSPETIKKLNTVEENLNSDNPEIFSQVLATCRRLFQDVADTLFKKYYPNYTNKTYKTKSGVDISIGSDSYLNRLSAVIEKLQDKSSNKTLIGSTIIHTIDWIENLHNLQCKGVHSDVTKDEALRCIIHTYICLGDILKAQKKDAEKQCDIER